MTHIISTPNVSYMNVLPYRIEPVCSAAKPLVSRDLSTVEVIYKGSSSVVTETECGQLVVVTNSQRGLVPGGLQISDKDFALFSKTISVHQHVSLGEFFQDNTLIPRPDLTLTRHNLDQTYLAQTLLIAQMSSTVSVQMLENLISQDAKRISTLVGAGAGATPAGDDILTGALAACLSTGDETTFKSLSRIVRNRLMNTTRASRHQLSWAYKRQFASIHLELIDQMSCKQPPTDVIENAKRIGHTSGIDFLLGFLVQSVQILKIKESKCQQAI